MRRVLACIGIAAAAFLTALPAATADPTTGEAAGQARGRAVISEVAPQTQLDFIEIGNQSLTTPLNLRGYWIGIIRSTSTWVDLFQIAQNAILQPLNAAAPEESFWTIALSPITDFPPDQTYVEVDIPRDGGVVLYNPNFVEVDRVAFSAPIAEGGNPAPQPPSFSAFSVARDVFLTDTNNNGNDFRLQTPTPDNLN